MLVYDDATGDWVDDGQQDVYTGDPVMPVFSGTTFDDPIVAEDGTTIYKQPDGSYVNADGTPVGSSGETSPTTDVTTDPNNPWADIGNQLKKLYTSGPNGTPDIAKIATLLSAGAGLFQSTNRTQPAGYQGSVDMTRKLVRQQLPQPTAPRAYGAPAMGRRYFTDTQYTNPAGLAAAQAAATQQAQELSAAQQPPTKAARGGLVSNGFVIPADVVSHFGNGSSEAGLKALATKLGATPIKGQGDGMSDSIKTHIDGKQKARVANEEAFVHPKKVTELGGGDPDKGAKKLYAMMDKIREARTGTKEQGKQINPSKYMPGGAVHRYTTGGTTSLPTGTTGTESNLSNWAGPYVTDMLSQGVALADKPYEAYTGALTAGTSPLQDKVFTGLEKVNFPSNLGASFTSAGTPTPGTVGADGTVTGGTPGQGIASQYMNPYLQNVLDPQLAELRRQSQINLQPSLAKLTQAGGFGGGRQAIMESEAARNLLQEQNKTVGQAYANAFDKGREQFNTEQGQAKTLVDILSQAGTAQRGIESEAVKAEKEQFEEERAYPYKALQFKQALLSGLPLAAQTFNQSPTNPLTNAASNAAMMNAFLKALNIIQ